MSQIQAFDFSVNLLQALLWQHNDAEKLQSLMQAKQAWYDKNQQQFWENWRRDVFDLRTANEFGLSVWSIILNLPLFVEKPPDSLDKPTFGFGEYRKNFGNGNFSSATGQNITLSTELKRIALRLRYYQLVSSGAIPETNRVLAEILAAYGKVYLLDGYRMTQRYVFEETIPSDLLFLLQSFDLLPRPAGVESSIISLQDRYYGFGSSRLNFDRGTFAPLQ